MTCLVLAAASIASCTQPRDLKRAPVEELVALAVRSQRDEPRDSDARRALAELASRPKPDVVASLLPMLRAEDAGIRATAAAMFGVLLEPFREPRADAATRAAAEAALLELLADSSADVRSLALLSYAELGMGERRDVVSQEVVAAIRELLTAEQVELRVRAVFATQLLGPPVAAVAPVLFDRWKLETDEGVQFLTTCALWSVAHRSKEAIAILCEALEVPYENTRNAAASSLGHVVYPSEPVVARLRSRLDAETETSRVRRSAAVSLSRLVRDPKDAERLLVRVLALRSEFGDFELDEWSIAVGRLAARCPDTEASREARIRLQEFAASEDEKLQQSATSALARIACGAKDVELGRTAAARLAPLLPVALADARRDRGWSEASTDHRPVVEALVDLAQWGAVEVDVESLRATLHEAGKRGPWRCRWWCEDELRRWK
ncbi:MAG: hypothetical protein ABL997_03965 [Planctomycetota bacterium]